MPDFDDSSLFLNDFAVDITLHLRGSDPVIEGLFFSSQTEIYQLVQLNTNDFPMALVKTEDITDLEKGQQITVADDHYDITGIEPDGTGWSMIKVEAEHAG